MFSKEEYWKRRNHVSVTRTEDGEISSATPAPLRGQEDLTPKPKLIKTSDVPYIKIGGQIIALNRKDRRRKTKNRKFTKKGYHFGMKIGGKEYKIVHHLAKIQASKKEPRNA